MSGVCVSGGCKSALWTQFLGEADKELFGFFFPLIFFCKLNPRGTEIQLGLENVVFEVFFICLFCCQESNES